jgi:hypothetical protein
MAAWVVVMSEGKIRSISSNITMGAQRTTIHENRRPVVL